MEKILNIGSDDKGYFVYENPGEPLFYGSYTQCLIIVGGAALGRDLEDCINLAIRVNIS